MTSNTIIIVDPDREFSESTKKFLLSQGFRVSLASNGRQAVRKIAAAPTLLVLLCPELPDMDGGSFLKKLQEIAPHQAVLVTGLRPKEEMDALVEGGVMDFSPKPIPQDALLKAIREAAALFNPLTPDLNQENDALLQKFFPFLIHELRNPLQAIGGAVSIIEKRSNLKDKALSQSLRIIKEEVQFINGFIQNCLGFIRPLNKGFWIEIDLPELVSECLKRIDYMYEGMNEGIHIQTDFAPSLPTIQANYEEIKEVLLNLLKNAIEAMEQGETKKLMIRIISKTFQGSGWLILTISDRGRGIREDQWHHLGTPFFTTKLRGTGLGLAICHKIIVERHKGKMMIEGQEGEGTTITIKLPVRSGPLRAGDKG